MVYRREVHRPRLPPYIRDRQRGRTAAKGDAAFLGGHLAREGSLVPPEAVLQIVWFWRVREVGQAGAEVLDLPCLTDAPAPGVIGSPFRSVVGAVATASRADRPSPS